MDTLDVIKYLTIVSQIGKSTKVTPETAADVLLLADRHCLGGLKQVETEWNIFFLQKPNSIFYTDAYAQEMMRKIVAEKAKYQESEEFLRQMRENPSLLAELFFL